MIKYALKCGDGHLFDVWFKDSASADTQLAAGYVACAVCGRVDVSKAIMAPAVAPSRRKTDNAERVKTDAESAKAAEPAPRAPVSAPTAAPPAAAPPPPTPEALRRILRARWAAVRAHVEANAENVGDRFADEARAIHDGDAEERAIWGECTLEEAAELAEEGVPCAPLPPVEPLDD